MSRLRVLVVDDFPFAAESLAEALTELGHEARTAQSGRAALETARVFRPHAIVCDLMLSGIDAVSLCQAIRRDPATASCSFVAVSGSADSSLLEPFRRAGVDAHVVKPASPEKLANFLRAQDSRDDGFTGNPELRGSGATSMTTALGASPSAGLGTAAGPDRFCSPLRFGFTSQLDTDTASSNPSPKLPSSAAAETMKLVETLQLAVTLALTGSAAGGHYELRQGLERVIRAGSEGAPWAGEVQQYWEAALAFYERFAAPPH